MCELRTKNKQERKVASHLNIKYSMSKVATGKLKIMKSSYAVEKMKGVQTS